MTIILPLWYPLMPFFVPSSLDPPAYKVPLTIAAAAEKHWGWDQRMKNQRLKQVEAQLLKRWRALRAWNYWGGRIFTQFTIVYPSVIKRGKLEIPSKWRVLRETLSMNGGNFPLPWLSTEATMATPRLGVDLGGIIFRISCGKYSNSRRIYIYII